MEDDTTIHQLWDEFQAKKKNRAVAIKWLLDLCRTIESEWHSAHTRRPKLALLRDCLHALSDHKHEDCRELAALAPRMMRTLDFDERHFLNLIIPFERKHSKGPADDAFCILTDDQPPASARGRTLPIVVVCDHLRSSFNVGAIFRTAECLGVRSLALCGYTATPDDSNVRRTSMGTDRGVEWEHYRSTHEALAQLRARGLVVVALETVADAPFAHEYAFPREGFALVLGNERHGVAPELLRECDTVVRLPCRGFKNSLNVAVSLAMTVYEAARQWGELHEPGERA